MSNLSRRHFIGTVAAGGAGLALSGCASVPSAEGGRSSKAFTFVHLTDMHVRSKRKGHEGWLACVEHVRKLNPLPQFALMGGDLAFDGNYTAKEEFSNQIDLYKDGADKLGIPYYNSIGNHDALGWSPRRKCAADDPDIGKKLIMDRLGMEKSYYSFNHGGWHFVVLDSIFGVTTENGPSQVPKIGDEQLEWLAKDLGVHHGMPTVAMTHIAAFCNIGQVNGDMEAKAMTGMVVRDNKALRIILERHGVKALLQGHSHETEDFFWNGVWYLTSPAVSAAWWGGTWTGSEQGYTVFTCDGDKLTWERKVFPWTHYLEPEDELERKKTAEYEAFKAEQKALLEKEIAGNG